MVHGIVWTPDQAHLFEEAHEAEVPILVGCRPGYIPFRDNGELGFVVMPERRLGGMRNCCLGPQCRGHTGDLLVRVLRPDDDYDSWIPGPVMCDSCAALLYLYGKAESESYRNADHIMFDADLRNNSSTNLRKIASLCLGEQPWDRARHHVEHVIRMYHLQITQFDEDGVPAAPNDILKLINAWISHMSCGYLTGKIDDTLSHWPTLQDPSIVKEMLSVSVRPPSYNVIYRVIIQDIESYVLWLQMQLHKQVICMLYPGGKEDKRDEFFTVLLRQYIDTMYLCRSRLGYSTPRLSKDKDFMNEASVNDLCKLHKITPEMKSTLLSRMQSFDPSMCSHNRLIRPNPHRSFNTANGLGR